jgi:hypothetical protein
MTQDCWYECGRCGGRIKFNPCQACEGLGVHEFFDESGLVLDGENCSACYGRGAFPICSSALEWCLSHPLPGQELTGRSSLGKFCIGGK